MNETLELLLSKEPSSVGSGVLMEGRGEVGVEEVEREGWAEMFEAGEGGAGFEVATGARGVGFG